MKMYGIKNCSTVKKAQCFLNTNNQAYSFHDFKTAGLTQTQIEDWLQHVDWQALVNKQSLTWRRLPESIKVETTNAIKAMELMLAHPSVIKRPILETANKVIVGFNENDYNNLL